MQSQQHRKPPSSESAGFFQETPTVKNAFMEDPVFRRIFAAYLSKDLQDALSPELKRFGSLALDPRILAYTADAERNPPYLKTWDSFGHRVDDIVTSQGWRALTALSATEGLVAIPYENAHGPYSRVHQFLKTHLWAPTAAQVSCPAAMSDGAARLLSRQLSRADPPLSSAERDVLAAAFDRLTSRDPSQAWTSGQWMTERPGGSDVSATETQAARTPTARPGLDAAGKPLGPYTIDGYKWFSSATDAQMTVLLARLPDGSLSAFYAPMRRHKLPPSSPPPPTNAAAAAAAAAAEDDGSARARTELNGIRPHRLKSKLGTRPVPTAELSLHGLRAWRLGAPGHGVRDIATILNITRVHNAVAAVGFLGRGLGVALAASGHRRRQRWGRGQLGNTEEMGSKN
ncbi:hypothetical protein MPH_09985 [Macrophomina phaseolina MS6]|uniref:Adaptive response protein AidB N-terminal domain-containing protein n=1 Tax=Macrophomina phaseolina (strain MS6) TaxID=1126212 RepID=K2QSR2_MACPH|nr:hypothetical protein MPH_09985 [Macrophomina phaseolina MS6]